MASLRDIRSKIASVRNINKITQAMKMVAAARLRKAQARVDMARPYADKLRELLVQVAPLVPDAVKAHEPLLAVGSGDDQADGELGRPRRIGLVLLTSDRGLAGSYNNNIIRLATEFVRRQRAEGKTVRVITIGRKGTQGMRKIDQQPERTFDMLDVDAPFSEVQAVTNAVVSLYVPKRSATGDDTGAVDEVHIAYTEFINAVTQQPRIDRFLPIEAGAVLDDEEPDTAPTETVEFEFEPDAATLLRNLLPRYVDNQVYQYLLEAGASEHGARMTAMTKASDNAKELIDTLTLEYNRSRQDAITREILDIVGGAEALA